MSTPAQLNKKWGHLLRPASEEKEMIVVSTGIPALDFALGVGGIPLGRQVELWGRYGIGKTAAVYYMLAEMQKVTGKRVGVINLEDQWINSWVKKCCPQLNLSQLDYADDVSPGFESVQLLAAMVDSGQYGMIVFDSIGAMLDDSEQDWTNSKRAFGQAGLVTHMAKLVRPLASRNQCTVIYINQARDPKPGAYEDQSPGGKAKEHLTSIRILLKSTDIYYETINGNREEVGFRVSAKLKKNKVGTTTNVAAWNFWRRPNKNGVIGIDVEGSLFDLAVNWGVIHKGGSWFAHPSFGKFQGLEKVIEYCDENPEARAIIKDELMQIAYEMRERELWKEENGEGEINDGDGEGT